jgi:hypothetical protein
MQLSAWIRVLENLTVAQLAKKFPPFVQPESSLLCSQDFATGPYSEVDKPSPRAYIVLFKIFYYYPLIYP